MNLKEASEVSELHKKCVGKIGDFIITNLLKFDELGGELCMLKELQYTKN